MTGTGRRTDSHATSIGVLTYMVLAFGISWVGVLLVVGDGGFPGSEADFATLLAPVVVAMLAGPSVGGIMTAVLFGGRAGLGDLWRRVRRWRSPIHIQAMAVLTAPLVVFSVLMGLSALDPVYRPALLTVERPWVHLAVGIGTGLAAGLFEEIGWTGYATPRLRRRHGLRVAGLILGIAWGAWHLLVTWWGSAATAGSLSMWIYLPALTLSFLPPYRILMTWVHDHTDSVLLAMVMHASLTASVRTFDPIAISGATIVTYQLALAAALWCLVALLPGGNRRARRSHVTIPG